MTGQPEEPMTRGQYAADRALTERRHAASELRRDGYETDLDSGERQSREDYADATEARQEVSSDQRQEASDTRHEAYTDAAEGRRDAQEQRGIAAAIVGQRRAIQLAALVIGLFLIDFFWSSHMASTASAARQQIENRAIAAQQVIISAACDFWGPLAPLPVTISTVTHKPTAVSVKIIAGARESFAKQCKGPVPPPDPSFVKWAGYYHVPVAR